ncbi:hypothetical protein BLS_009186, partial [Venturia inaequalis]
MKAFLTFIPLLLANTAYADYYKCSTGKNTDTKSGKCWLYRGVSQGITEITKEITEEIDKEVDKEVDEEVDKEVDEEVDEKVDEEAKKVDERFYYCGICYEEMHPPTPTSRHAYDRRCHECHVVLGINGFVTIIPTLQDAWVAMLFVEEGAMPFVEEGAMPFVEEGAMPFVEEGAMPFVEEGAMPFEEEEKKETYHLGLGKLPKTPTFRAILQRIREFLPWGLGQSHRYEELSEDVESCLPLPVPRGLGQGCQFLQQHQGYYFHSSSLTSSLFNMVATNAVNKTSLHPTGIQPQREHTEIEEELHERAHIDYDRVAIIANPSVAALYEDALVFETGSAITASGALSAYSGAKTGRSPSDKRVVQEPSSEKDVWWGPVNKPMTQD